MKTLEIKKEQFIQRWRYGYDNPGEGVDFEDELDDLLKSYHAQCNAAVTMQSSWDIRSILGKLVEAADILLHKKDYDGHGWEEIEICYKKGLEILQQQPNPSEMPTSSMQGLIERVEKCKVPYVEPNSYYHGVNVGIKVAIEILRATPCIQAKALRKRGTNQWYIWNNYYSYFEKCELPIPLFGQTVDYDHPKDAELVDIQILVP